MCKSVHDWASKGVLVVGAGGFLGSHLVSSFQSQEIEVYLAHYDRKRRVFFGQYNGSNLGLDELMVAAGPSAVIYAAGGSSVGASWQHPADDYSANVSSFQVVLEAVRQFQPTARIVYLSSAAVYGESAGGPLDEDAPKRPISPYGWHKLMAETLCLNYATSYGLAVAAARPFSVIGPGQKKLLLWDAMEQLRRKGCLQLMGTGYEERDFIAVADVVAAIKLILQNAQFKGESYNVASGQSHCIKDVANILTSIARCDKVPSFVGTTMAGYPLKWRVDIKKLQGLGFQPRLSLRETIQQVWEWYEAEHLGN